MDSERISGLHVLCPALIDVGRLQVGLRDYLIDSSNDIHILRVVGILIYQARD